MLNPIQQNDEAIDLARYKQAAEEIEVGKKDDALWYKAFAEASGNEQATKAAYIRLRVDQLRRAAIATAAVRTDSTQVAQSIRQPLPSTTDSPCNLIHPKSLYEVLGVTEDSTYEQIIEGHRKKKEELDTQDNQDAESHNKLILIQHARDVLLDSVKRAQYDAQISAEIARPPNALPDITKARANNSNGDLNPLEQRDLYRAYLGEKNTDYYLKKFEAFDQKGDGLHASWNWPAFLFVVWELYRKLYGWFFALLVTYSVLNFLPGSWSLLMLIPWFGFAIFANSLYHNQVKKKIAATQPVARSNDELLQLLRHKGGVHAWVIWAFFTVFIFGILVAVLLPAISEKSKSRPVAEQSAEAKVAPRPPTLAEQLLSEGWTQESTGSTEVGPWLNNSPPGTRYCRYADRTIYRVYPPGVMPNAEKANPFCVGDSTEYVPQ
jgi:curved DNA-binding protein CbpA